LKKRSPFFLCDTSPPWRFFFLFNSDNSAICGVFLGSPVDRPAGRDGGFCSASLAGSLADFSSDRPDGFPFRFPLAHVLDRHRPGATFSPPSCFRISCSLFYLSPQRTPLACGLFFHFCVSFVALWIHGDFELATNCCRFPTPIPGTFFRPFPFFGVPPLSPLSPLLSSLSTSAALRKRSAPATFFPVPARNPVLFFFFPRKGRWVNGLLWPALRWDQFG